MRVCACVCVGACCGQDRLRLASKKMLQVLTRGVGKTDSGGSPLSNKLADSGEGRYEALKSDFMHFNQRLEGAAGVYSVCVPAAIAC